MQFGSIIVTSRRVSPPIRLSRAEVLRGGSAALLAATLPWPIANLATAAEPGLSEIAPGVFVHRGVNALATAENGGDICNTGFIVGQSAVAVIDTGGSFKAGTHLRAAIAQTTGLPVRYVVNTHMHPDHVLGNAAFEGEGVAFVGHNKLLRALSERAESYLEGAKENLGEEAFAGTKVVLPTRGVEGQDTIDLGGRTLTLTARPTAHTSNDLTIADSQTGTLFLGDLVFAEHLPTLDGSLRGWLKLLAVLEAEPASRVVPGHGPPTLAWPAGDTDIKRYLNTLATDVRASIAAGKTMTDAMQSAAQSESGKWQLFREHNARNVSAAFAELEWE